MSYTDLGQRTKAKYAGQYDDLSDDDLGKKIAAKYPGQYDDIVGATPSATAAPAKIIQSAGQKKASAVMQSNPVLKQLDDYGNFARGANDNFMGGLIRGGAGLLKLLTPDSVDKKIDTGTRRIAPMPDTSTAEGAAGAKLGGAEKFAAENVPLLLLGPGKSLVSRAAQSAGVGAVNAAAASGAEGKNSGQQLKDALVAAAGSGLLSAGGEAVTRTVKPALTGVADAAYNRLFKTPVAQRDAGRELIGTGIMKRGLVGDEGQIAEQLRSSSQAAAKNVKDIIEKKAGQQVDISQVNKALQQLQSRTAATPGEATAGIDAVASHFAPTNTLPLVQAQETKQNLQKAVSDAFLRQNTTGTTEAQKTAAQGLRAAIEKAVPEVAAPNKEQEFAIRAIKQLTRQEGAAPSKLRLFAELIGVGSGIATGNPAILATVLSERLATNPKVVTRAAQVAYKAGSKSIDPLKAAAGNRLLSALIGKGVSGSSGQ